MGDVEVGGVKMLRWVWCEGTVVGDVEVGVVLGCG